MKFDHIKTLIFGYFLFCVLAIANGMQQERSLKEMCIKTLLLPENIQNTVSNLGIMNVDCAAAIITQLSQEQVQHYSDALTEVALHIAAQKRGSVHEALVEQFTRKYHRHIYIPHLKKIYVHASSTVKELIATDNQLADDMRVFITETVDVEIKRKRGASTKNSLVWSPNRKQYVYATKNHLIIHNVNNGLSIDRQHAELSQQEIRAIAWSADSNYVATGAMDNTAKIWDVHGNCIATLHGHTHKVVAVAWSPDGEYLATASYDNTAKIWHKSGTCVATLHHAGVVVSVAWSPDSMRVVTGSYDCTVALWDRQGNLIKSAKQDEMISLVTWSPDGQHILTFERKFVTIYNENLQKKCPHILLIHTSCFSVAWLFDNTYIATLEDGNIVIYSLQSGKALTECPVANIHTCSLHWSADDNTLLGNFDQYNVDMLLKLLRLRFSSLDQLLLVYDISSQESGEKYLSDEEVAVLKTVGDQHDASMAEAIQTGLKKMCLHDQANIEE